MTINTNGLSARATRECHHYYRVLIATGCHPALATRRANQYAAKRRGPRQ